MNTHTHTHTHPYTHTTIYQIDNQQRPIVQYREPYSIFCDNPHEKRLIGWEEKQKPTCKCFLKRHTFSNIIDLQVFVFYIVFQLGLKTLCGSQGKPILPSPLFKAHVQALVIHNMKIECCYFNVRFGGGGRVVRCFSSFHSSTAFFPPVTLLVFLFLFFTLYSSALLSFPWSSLPCLP